MTGAFRVTRLLPVRVEWRCDCGGTMVMGDIVHMMHPPSYPHVCNKCGRTESAGKAYPCVEHREDVDGFVHFEKAKP